MRCEIVNAIHRAQRRLLPFSAVVVIDIILQKMGHFSALASMGVAEIDDAATVGTIAKKGRINGVRGCNIGSDKSETLRKSLCIPLLTSRQANVAALNVSSNSSHVYSTT